MAAPRATANSPAASEPDRRSEGDVDPGQPADQALAGDADQQRKPELRQFRQPAQQLDRVSRPLGEADARVEGDLRAADAGAFRGGDACGQFRGDLGGDIRVGRVRLHGRRGAAHVHEHDGTTARGDQRRGIGVMRQGGDVVDDAGSGVERGRHGDGVTGVDGEHQPGGRERANDRDDPGALLLGADWRGTGTGALAADVDDVGARLRPLPARRRWRVAGRNSRRRR